MASQILGKSFVILETLAKEFGGQSVTELSRTVDLNISTVHRILNSLMDRGYVQQDEERRYSISMKFVELSSFYLNSLDLKKEADPFLIKLSTDLNMTVFLATEMDNQVVYIDRHAVHDGLRRYASIGERRPLYCTSLGKSLLLGYSDKEIHDYAHSVEYISFSNHTITNADDLLDEIKRTASQGWSEDNEELERDVSCRAAPIFDYRGHIIAATSISGAKELVTGENGPQIIRAMVETAASISRCLGFTDPAQEKESELS